MAGAQAGGVTSVGRTLGLPPEPPPLASPDDLYGEDAAPAATTTTPPAVPGLRLPTMAAVVWLVRRILYLAEASPS